MGEGTADRRREAQLRRRAVRRRRRLTLGAIAAATALFVAAVVLAGDGGATAPSGVRVAGVEVGGMSRGQLEDVVRRRARELMRVPLVIESTDPASRFRTVVTRSALGARPRVRRAVEQALEPRNVVGRALGQVGIATDREVPLRFTVDAAGVDAVARRVTDQLNRPPAPAGLRVRGREIALVPARSGRGVDPERLRRRIRALPRRIVVRRAELPPPIDDAAAARAREHALRVVDAPVGVAFRGRQAPLTTDVLWRALRVRAAAPELRVALDPGVLHAAVRPAFAGRERPAREAGFAFRGEAVSVVPSRTGRRLAMERIAADIVAAPDATSVPARFEVVTPERTTAEARALRITAKVSEFTTSYACCEPRVTNIARAAEIIDGTIIPAGGRFSLNEALGERTEERGFVAAPQIAAGRLEDAVGGGVSQVATTLFNAAFFAGLEIVTHTPHQLYISRYPPGREATVSYGGPELVFVNDWDAAVLIDAVATDTSVTVRMYSSSLGRRVETTTGEPEDTVAPEVIETVDPDLEPGARQVEQELGGPGFTIRYTRRVLVDGRVKRDEEYRWTYDPHDAYVTVGPEPEPEPEPEPPTETERSTAPTPDGAGGGTTAPRAPEDPPARRRGAAAAGGDAPR